LSGSGTTGISEMFRIDQVIFTNGLYNICFTNDHYLEITNGTTSVEQVAPLRTFTTSNSFEIALSASGQQISAIADQNIPPNGSSNPLSFNFGNLGSTAGLSLAVLASSANQSLVPNGNLVFGGSGTNRTITVTPAPGQTGTSLITVSVTDGVWTNSRSFNVIVSDFALTTSPASQGVLVGGSASYNATVSATNGFNGTVTFNVSGVPAGVSAVFNPPTIIGAGSATLNIIASNSVWTNTAPTDGVQERAIDYAESLNEDKTSPLYHRLDLDKVGAMGHSQGAAATIKAAMDPRVKSVIFWNYGTTNEKPFLTVSGDHDVMTPTVDSISMLAGKSTQPAEWLFFHQILQTGGNTTGHLVLMEQPDRVWKMAVDYWDWQLKGDEKAKKTFVGSDCGLCNSPDQYDYGVNSNVQ